jgi:hypothetical protein
MSQNGRVEPMTTQGFLPKSCRSLNLEMENFASYPQWPVLAQTV